MNFYAIRKNLFKTSGANTLAKMGKITRSKRKLMLKKCHAAKMTGPPRVGVQHPRNHSELIDTVLMENGVLVTSGDYKRFRIVSKKRYHHIFDPQTGYPCPQNQSLTIRTSGPIAADILSAGLFCKSAG